MTTSSDYTQTEDINIPLLAVVIAGFAASLLLIILFLQVWFYNMDSAERDAKWRHDPILTAAFNQYNNDLYDPAGLNPRIPNVRRIPIDDAIAATVKRYAQGEGK
ncbi:MAG: hypothetical protein FWD61_02985 [Phycisphaerales bacterium]|nr:hypothetical protein [Phycisphaerales bacterium]